MSQRQSLKSSSMMIQKKIKKRTPIAIQRTVVPIATTRMVKQIINNSVETKFLDGFFGSAGGNSGNIFTLVLPGQGSTDSTRVGDDIKPVMWELRGYLSGGNIHAMRVVLFQWHIESTTAPTFGNILNGAASGTSTQAPFAFPAWDYQKTMFNILSDKMFYAQGTGTDMNILNYRVKIPGTKLRKIHFINGSTTDCFNGLYMLTVQDGAVTLNTLNCSSRLTWKDA